MMKKKENGRESFRSESIELNKVQTHTHVCTTFVDGKTSKNARLFAYYRWSLRHVQQRKDIFWLLDIKHAESFPLQSWRNWQTRTRTRSTDNSHFLASSLISSCVNKYQWCIKMTQQESNEHLSMVFLSLLISLLYRNGFVHGHDDYFFVAIFFISPWSISKSINFISVVCFLSNRTDVDVFWLVDDQHRSIDVESQRIDFDRTGETSNERSFRCCYSSVSSDFRVQFGETNEKKTSVIYFSFKLERFVDKACCTPAHWMNKQIDRFYRL